MCFSVGAFVVFGSIFFISYGYLGTAEIPVTIVSSTPALLQNSYNLVNWTQWSINNTLIASSPQYGQMSSILTIPVSFPVYFMAFMSFFGWWLFVLFGGIGLSALPLDLMQQYKFRPRFRDPKDLIAQQKELKEKTVSLLEKGEAIERISIIKLI